MKALSPHYPHQFQPADISGLDCSEVKCARRIQFRRRAQRAFSVSVTLLVLRWSTSGLEHAIATTALSRLRRVQERSRVKLRIPRHMNGYGSCLSPREDEDD